MLRGDRVILRARRDEDVAVLDAGLYNDVPLYVRASARPWRPLPPGSPDSPYAVRRDESGSSAVFSVVEIASDQLAGSAGLSGIDQHGRSGHLGLGLLPAFQGKGLGTDVVRVLCSYGFDILGLHRLQLETLPDNDGMTGAARRAGFTQEGRFREAAWINGQFADEVVFGLLAADWRNES